MIDIYEVMLARSSYGKNIDFSAYATSLLLEIDSSTYVVTATLKNKNGDTLGSPQTIDLPLETVVVGGSYDDSTKKVILTLKNGNTIEFSVADLVDGLQPEITANNKLSSDLVDDTNQTNKFVTSSEKTKIANALTSEEYNAGKTTPSGTTYNIDGTIYTVGDNAEVFNAYSNNKAIGNYSHAEGNGTTTLGKYSHAEGESTTASGPASHAEGAYTIASSAHQHVQGKCNIEDSNDKYAFIIGNGTENNRSNAFSIDWDGKIYVNNAVTGVDVSTLQSTVTDIQTTIGNINAVLEEVL